MVGMPADSFSNSIISLICSIAVHDDSFKLSTISCTILGQVGAQVGVPGYEQHRGGWHHFQAGQTRTLGTLGNASSSCPKMSPAMAMVFSGPRTSCAMCRTMARFASSAAALCSTFCCASSTFFVGGERERWGRGERQVGETF